MSTRRAVVLQQTCRGALRELLVQQCRRCSPVLVQRHCYDVSGDSEDTVEPSLTWPAGEHHVADEEALGLQKVKPKVDVQPPEAAKILRYLRRSVKLTDQDIHSYSYTTPSALGSSLADIQARVEKLQRVSFDRSSNKERLGIVLARFPHVVEADLVNAHSVCQLLEKYKFNRNWVRSLLKHHAHLFTHDPKKLEMNLEVMTQAGLTGRDIFQLLNKMPLLLTHQMKQDLGQVIQHWKQLMKEEADKQKPC